LEHQLEPGEVEECLYFPQKKKTDQKRWSDDEKYIVISHFKNFIKLEKS